MDKKDTSWESVAPWYDNLLEGDKDSYQRRVILPNLLRIVDASKPARIIDLACGQGFFTALLAKEGREVVGVDLSPLLIKVAAERHREKKKLSFIVAPAHAVPLPDAFADVITVVLAIQNIKNLSETIKETSRLLKEKGKLIFILSHPAFRIPQKTFWEFDEKKDIQFRRVTEYLSESAAVIEMTPGKKGGPTTESFHRPLQVYSKVLANNDFAIARIEEWISHKKSEKGPRQIAEDKARKEIPLFMMIEALRV